MTIHRQPEPRDPKISTTFVDDIDQKAVIKALAVLVVFLGIIAALLTTVGNGQSATLTNPDPTTTAEINGSPSTSAAGNSGNPDPEELSGNAGQVTTGVNTGDGGATGPSSGGQTVEPTSPPVDPCVAVLEAGDAVLVSPDPAILESGVMSSELTLTNCTDAPVDWTAATKPWVELAHDAGSLNEGSSSTLAYDIDSGAISPGAFDFKIKVSTPGANTYVDVSGFRPSFGTDFIDPDMGLTAGQGAGGCNNDCITRAWLTSNATTPNVNLEMSTNVPAKMWVFVSTDAPQMIDGRPAFPGVAPAEFNNSYDTSLTVLLEPLEAATKYHIIVKAEDQDGNSQWESGSFTTRTPAEGPTDFAGPGCELQCIIKALVNPTDDPANVTIDVATIVPAEIELFVSTDPFAFNENGTTPIVGNSPTAHSGDEMERNWSTTVTGLEPGTKHYIVVRATDSDGDISLLAGDFTTEDEPPVDLWISLHEVRITHDGDPSLGNRGEIEVGWGVGDDFVGSIGEQKLKDGAVVRFDGFIRTYRLEDVALDSFIPFIRVWAIERDADLRAEFCTAGTSVVHTEPGSNGDCDTKWNVNELQGLILVDSIDTLPRCSSYGVEGVDADQACLQLQSVGGLGSQYARFEAIVVLRTSAS